MRRVTLRDTFLVKEPHVSVTCFLKHAQLSELLTKPDPSGLLNRFNFMIDVVREVPVAVKKLHQSTATKLPSRIDIVSEILVQVANQSKHLQRLVLNAMNSGEYGTLREEQISYSLALKDEKEVFEN